MSNIFTPLSTHSIYTLNENSQSHVTLELCDSAWLPPIFTPGRESFPWAALSPHPSSPPTPNISGCAQPAGLPVLDPLASTDIS